MDETNKRLDDKELELLFEKHGPLALGFLLDTMVSALSILPSIVIEDKPRLMDFTKLGAAVGQVIDPEKGEAEFLDRYKESREAASMQALDSMPVITSLIDYLELHAHFTGNYSELLKEIEGKIGKTVDAAWPRSARGLSDAVGRAKPTLNLLGWTVSVGARTNKGASVTIKKADSQHKNSADLSNTTSTTYTESAESDGCDGRADEIGTVTNHENSKKLNTNNLTNYIESQDRVVI